MAVGPGAPPVVPAPDTPGDVPPVVPVPLVPPPAFEPVEPPEVAPPELLPPPVVEPPPLDPPLEPPTLWMTAAHGSTPVERVDQFPQVVPVRSAATSAPEASMAKTSAFPSPRIQPKGSDCDVWLPIREKEPQPPLPYESWTT